MSAALQEPAVWESTGCTARRMAAAACRRCRLGLHAVCPLCRDIHIQALSCLLWVVSVNSVRLCRCAGPTAAAPAAAATAAPAAPTAAPTAGPAARRPGAAAPLRPRERPATPGQPTGLSLSSLLECVTDTSNIVQTFELVTLSDHGRKVATLQPAGSVHKSVCYVLPGSMVSSGQLVAKLSTRYQLTCRWGTHQRGHSRSRSPSGATPRGRAPPGGFGQGDPNVVRITSCMALAHMFSTPQGA